MNYKLAIFDMDGTILDTLEDLTDALNHTLESFGLPVKTIDQVRSYVGNGIHKLIERAVPKNTADEVIEEIFQAYIPYYQKHSADKTRAYEGIPEVIQTLKNNGVSCAVVSNKADAAVHSLCEQYFRGMFDAAAGERAGLAKKPAPDLCKLVLDELGIDAKDAVYIGDSEVDIATAKNSNLDEIIVSWGFRTREYQLECGAKRIIDHPEEILDIILG